MKQDYLTLETIQSLCAKDMKAVDALILEHMHSDVYLVSQLGNYIVSGGGKRIRPMIAVLAAQALNIDNGSYAHITVATFIEFIHTATLLHDDVVDESDKRRGKETANAVFGNAASVLVGDFIYTRAFQLMTKLNSLRILQIMSDATNVIAEGEVLQLMNCNDPDTTEASYMQVIYSKTARLFEVATRCAAIVADATKEQEMALQEYGRYLGTAFQLVDDVLDYQADQSKLGKNIGDDLAEGKPTLPLLHAMRSGTAEQQTLIRTIIEQGNGREHLDQVLAIMQQYGSLDYAMDVAKKEAQKAVDALIILPDNQYKKALESLAYLSVMRQN